MENIVVSRFEKESEAYQAFSDVKNDAFNTSCCVSEGSLVKKENGSFRTVESFNGGQYVDDTLAGGLIGALIGILGGPIGVLLGGELGLVGGGAVDIHDYSKDRSMIERVMGDVCEDCTFMVLLAEETGPEVLDYKLSKCAQTTTRYDAAEVMEEVRSARDLQKSMAKEARKELRESKGEERRARVEQNRRKLRERFGKS